MKAIGSKGFKLNAQDKKAFEHFVLVKPKKWCEDALSGMLNKAIKTILRDWLPKYKETNETITANLAQLIPAIVAMEGFKPYNYMTANMKKAKRKDSNAKDIEIWDDGFDIEDWQETALKAFYADPEQQLYDFMENKIACRKEAFEREYEPKLYADPEVQEIPRDVDDLIDLIASKADYKNRKLREADRETL